LAFLLINEVRSLNVTNGALGILIFVLLTFITGAVAYELLAGSPKRKTGARINRSAW
jgi:hypothetical protein